MKDIHLKYKRETGRDTPCENLTLEQCEFIDDYLLVDKELIEPYAVQKHLKVHDPDYIEWLEAQVNELSEKLKLIESTIQN